MIFTRTLIMAIVAIGASAAPAPSPPTTGTLDQPADDRCADVICPENSVCKVFDFRLEQPVGCEANGTVPADAETCGSVICPTGTTCCNPTCGVCAKPEEACLQWVC